MTKYVGTHLEGPLSLQAWFKDFGHAIRAPIVFVCVLFLIICRFGTSVNNLRIFDRFVGAFVIVTSNLLASKRW